MQSVTVCVGCCSCVLPTGFCSLHVHHTRASHFPSGLDPGHWAVAGRHSAVIIIAIPRAVITPTSPTITIIDDDDEAEPEALV